MTTPIEAFRYPVTVDLGNFGVAPLATFGGYATATSSLTSPSAFSSIVSVTPAAGGLFTINWTVQLAGTVGAPEANNFRLFFGATFIPSVNAAAVGTYPQAPVGPVALGPGETVTVGVAANNATAGAIYTGTIPSASSGATAQVGPQGVGESWALDQCYVSTSVGQLDTAQCIVYVGPLPLGTYAVTGSLSGGSAQFGLGGLLLEPGWFVWAVWTGGTFGEFGQLRVTGAKTALTA
jgi:hypothetical protein